MRLNFLLLVVDIDVLGVDNAFVFLLLVTCARGSRAIGGACAPSSGGGCAGLVHCFGQLVRSSRQLLTSVVELTCASAALQFAFGIGQSRLDLAPLGAGDFVPVLLEHL